MSLGQGTKCDATTYICALNSLGATVEWSLS